MSASNGVLILLGVWFLALGGACLAYLRDARGWLTRVVNQRVVAAQHAAFDMQRSTAQRPLTARQVDRLHVRRQQRIAAGCGLAMSAAVVTSCLVALGFRI